MIREKNATIRDVSTLHGVFGYSKKVETHLHKTCISDQSGRKRQWPIFSALQKVSIELSI